MKKNNMYAFFLFVLTCLAAWTTHIIWVIMILLHPELTVGDIILSVLGAFVPPVGILHGFLLWFGVV